jgi:hypothetical protein
MLKFLMDHKVVIGVIVALVAGAAYWVGAAVDGASRFDSDDNAGGE